MNSPLENQMELDIFIQKCQNIARTKNLDLSTFLSQTSTHLIFDMLKSYEKIKTMFTQMTADNYLEDFLIFAMAKLQFLEPNETAILSLDGATDIWQKLQEKQYFYNQSERYQITKLTSVLFIKKDKESSQKNKLSYLRQRDCLPLCLIVQGQTNILKYLHIQYKLKTSKRFAQQQLYSISSKQLFKIIDQNELLKEVVIKGVEIQLFQQFIKILNQEEIEKGQNWIKQFKPKKSLKVSINVTLFFNLSKKQQTIGRINNLSYFIKLFLSLSNIFVLILLGRWNEIKQWSKQLLDLYEILKMVKHSRIKILGWGYYKQICQQSIPLVRSVIFGGLASFTEIDQLSFKEIRFDRQFFTNCILSIEQSLRTIFNNNAISHLSLQDCQYFPLIQRIQTLQSIILSGVTFRKSFCILSQIPQKNLKLRSIKYQAMHQQWRLSQSLFNQLQTFMIDSCHNISLENSFSRSPSNIKHLSIQISSLGTSQYLLIIFPKLINLSYLYLSHAIFNRQILIIPSNQLQELHISWNGSLSEECFKDIDLRWPFLTFITIRQCRNITENIWRLCEFKGLVKLQTDSKLGNNKKTADYLKDREIKLIIND